MFKGTETGPAFIIKNNKSPFLSTQIDYYQRSLTEGTEGTGTEVTEGTGTERTEGTDKNGGTEQQRRTEKLFFS